MQEIEEIIKEIRNRLILIKNQEDLSNDGLGEIAGGVSRETIRKILNGTLPDPGVSIFINIARNLAIDLAWLLEGRGKPMLLLNETSNMETPKNELPTISISLETLRLKEKIEDLQAKLLEKSEKVETLLKVIDDLKDQLGRKTG